MKLLELSEMRNTDPNGDPIDGVYQQVRKSLGYQYDSFPYVTLLDSSTDHTDLLCILDVPKHLRKRKFNHAREDT